VPGFFSEEAPASGTQSSITADQALQIAQVEDDPAVETATPVLVLFTAANDARVDEVLAWDIQESGCFSHPWPSPAPGASAETPPPCDSEQHYVIDATTGDVIEVDDL